MFNPSNFNFNVDPWKTKYKSVLVNTLLVMNSLRFTKTQMREFKNGARFESVINGAKYRINYESTKEMMKFINEGHHKRWSFARIHIDPDDGRIRCFLIERDQNKNEFTHYLTVRDNKVVLVNLQK